jgi:hypothetical protein
MNNRSRRLNLQRSINSFNERLAPSGLGISCEKALGANYYVKFFNNRRSVSTVIYSTIGNTLLIFETNTINPNNRRKGYAEKLLAIILKCAQQTGYESASAESMFMNNNNRALSSRFHSNGKPRPLSAGLFNKLGFGINRRNLTNGTESRTLNMNRNIPGVNSVIRNL